MMQATTMGMPGDSAVKTLPAMQEMWVQSLAQEDPLEKEMSTCFTILAWEIPWTEVQSLAGNSWQITVHGVAK